MSQYGAIEVVLSRQFLVGALRGPFEDLVRDLGLRAEHSFNDHGDVCRFAYFETDDDAFTLVKWDPAESVDVYAYIDPRSGPGTDFGGRAELDRFRGLAKLSPDRVVFPPQQHRAQQHPTQP